MIKTENNDQLSIGAERHINDMVNDEIARRSALDELSPTVFAPFRETKLVVTDQTADFVRRGYRARVYTGAHMALFVAREMLSDADREGEVGQSNPVTLLQVDGVFAGIYHHVEVVGLSRVILNSARAGSVRGDGSHPAVEWRIPPESVLVAWWHPTGVDNAALVFGGPHDVASLDGAPC